MSRPTAAQRRVLAKAAAHPAGRVTGGDPATRRKLIERGWIVADGHRFDGPLYTITAAGREAIAPSAKATPAEPIPAR